MYRNKKTKEPVEVKMIKEKGKMSPMLIIEPSSSEDTKKGIEDFVKNFELNLIIEEEENEGNSE